MLASTIRAILFAHSGSGTGWCRRDTEQYARLYLVPMLCVGMHARVQSCIESKIVIGYLMCWYVLQGGALERETWKMLTYTTGAREPCMTFNLC